MDTFTPSPESSKSPLKYPITRAALGGVTAALLAAFPVSAIKTMALLYGICTPLTFDGPVALSTCGVFFNTWEFSNAFCQAYLVLTALGAALTGVFTGKLAIHRARARTISGSDPPPSRIFWWGALGGLIFDLIFVFIFLYPGQ